MQRRFLFIVAIAFLVLRPNVSVHAQTPQIDARAVDAGTNNKPINQGKSQSINPTDTAPPGPMEFGGSDEKAASPFKYTDQSSIGRWFKSAVSRLNPNTIQDNTIHANADGPKFFISVSKLKEIVSGDDNPTQTKISESNVRTSPIPAIGENETQMRTINSFYTGYSVPMTNGKYDYRRTPLEVVNPPAGCDDAKATTEQPAQTVLVKNFGFLEMIRLVFDWVLGTDQTKNGQRCIASRTYYQDEDLHDCLMSGCHDDSKSLPSLDSGDEKEAAQMAGIGTRYIVYDQNGKASDTTMGKTHAEQNNSVSLDGGSETITTRDTYASANLATAKTIKCAIAPNDVQASQGLTDADCRIVIPTEAAKKDCDSYFTDPTPDEEAKDGASGNGGGLGFNIPFRDSSCVFLRKEAVAKYASDWLGGNAQASANVMEYWDTIVKYAEEYSWSPAYLMTLWIEETAAGATGAQEMGCLYRHNSTFQNYWKGLPKSSDTCEQLACVIDYPHKATLQNFICSYSGESSANCSATVNNPCHAANIFKTYTELSDRAGIDPHCYAGGWPSQALRTSYCSKCVGASKSWICNMAPKN